MEYSKKVWIQTAWKVVPSKLIGICKYLQNELGSCFLYVYICYVCIVAFATNCRRMGKTMVPCTSANLQMRDQQGKQPAGIRSYQGEEYSSMHFSTSSLTSESLERMTSRPEAYTATRISTSALLAGSTHFTAVCSKLYPVFQ